MAKKIITALCSKVIGPRGYKTFLCSTQPRMKFQLLIKTKIPINGEVSCLKSHRCCIYPVYQMLKCQQLLAF